MSDKNEVKVKKNSGERRHARNTGRGGLGPEGKRGVNGGVLPAQHGSYRPSIPLGVTFANGGNAS
jgi:hypothetical protein